MSISGFGRKSLSDLKKSLRKLGYELPEAAKEIAGCAQKMLAEISRKFHHAASIRTPLQADSHAPCSRLDAAPAVRLESRHRGSILTLADRAPAENPQR